jgi:hypothetical protein
MNFFQNKLHHSSMSDEYMGGFAKVYNNSEAYWDAEYSQIRLSFSEVDYSYFTKFNIKLRRK